jgi:hypothetical protein
VAPDGTSRKADHDKVNEIFYAAYGPALAEMARRFDPTIDDGDVPGTTLDQQALVQLIVEWREEAWWNAQRLVSAPNPTARALVAQSIENAAATKAEDVPRRVAVRAARIQRAPRRLVRSARPGRLTAPRAHHLDQAVQTARPLKQPVVALRR